MWWWLLLMLVMLIASVIIRMCSTIVSYDSPRCQPVPCCPLILMRVCACVQTDYVLVVGSGPNIARAKDYILKLMVKADEAHSRGHDEEY